MRPPKTKGAYFPLSLLATFEAPSGQVLTLMKRIARIDILAVLATISLFVTPYAGRAEAKPNQPLRQVIIVFKTHFDIGYTDLASNVVRRYRTTMIDDALRVVEQNRDLPPEQQFVWTVPGWPMSQITEDWPGQTPERKQRILAALKAGRFVVHALPFTTHTELLEPEDLVRGLDFASQVSRAVGLALPRDAKMTDVPCHSWILPTLLKHAGVDFLHLGCNAASSSPRVPRLFWWEGPGGSRLLTMYIAEGYGTGLLPPADWPYQTWLALIHTGDNHGPPRPEEVKKLLDEAKQKLPGATVRIGRLADFADAILGENADLPVVRGDMPDTWIHGPLCDPAGARIARNVRPLITVAEALNTLLPTWGIPASNDADTIARAYEKSLLYGEHTWGGALYWVTKYSGGAKWGYGDTWKADHAAKRFQRLEDSWAEHTAYIEAARDLITPLLQREMSALAHGTNHNSVNPSHRIVVYNPLPWPRDGLVQVAHSNIDLKTLPAVVSDQQLGSESPVVRTDDGFQFIAKRIPAMAYAIYSPAKAHESAPSRIDAKSATMETPVFKAVLDSAHGAIRSLVDKRSGRELVDTSAAHGFGQYLYERFDSNQVAGFVKAYVKINTDWAINELGKPNLPPASEAPYRAVSPQNCQVAYTTTPFSVTASLNSTASAELPYPVTTRLTLYSDQPYADLEVTLHHKPADPWPEAGWICLPFKIEAPQFRLGRLGSIIDPVKDVARGANRHLFGINTGVALFGPDGAGVGLCSLDSPLVSLDTPGCWKYSLEFVPRWPAVYVNLFNNQWTTNFRLWNEGTWTFRVRIWAYQHYAAERCLITPSLEARFPLQAVMAEGAAEALPEKPTGLSLSRKGVMVTAFGPNPDGAGTVLRLWELAGQSGRVEVQLPAGLNVRTVQPVNLRGQPAGPTRPLARAAFETDLHAFAPVSFVLQ